MRQRRHPGRPRLRAGRTRPRSSTRRRRSRWRSPGAAIPNAAIELLREAEATARDLDDPDALFRITANLTTVLDLVGRRAEAVDVAYRGIEDARQAGLEAVYGNFLAGNVMETAGPAGALAGGARAERTALAWQPVGVAFLMGIVQLATVEIESDAGERAAQLLGQTVLEFDALRELAVRRCRTTSRPRPTGCGAATSPTRAGRSNAAGPSSRTTEEWVLAARMAAMVARVDAAVGCRGARAAAAGAARWPPRSRTASRPAATRRAWSRRRGAGVHAGSRRIAEAYLATARGYQRRLEGDDDADVWSRVAPMWADLTAPYEVALARWRQAEAILAGDGGRSGRAVARKPLLESVRLALGLEARPLLRELAELAGRALIEPPARSSPLAMDDAAGPVTVAILVEAGRATPRRPPVPRRSSGCSPANRRAPAARRADTFGLSAAGSGRCWRWSRRAGRTGRSGSACSSARRRSASTSGTSCPSWRCRAASRPRRWPSGWA